MAVQKWRVLDADVLIKPGIQSRQLVWPKNSPESQTTITQVTMEPGSVPIATLMSALRRSGLSNVEKASFYSKMNTAKFFVREILFVRQQAKSMGWRIAERSRSCISPSPLRHETSLTPTRR
jgi:hypothetical protein